MRSIALTKIHCYAAAGPRQLLLALLILMLPVIVQAEFNFPTEYRISESIGKYDDVNQYALVIPAHAPSILLADRMELAMGAISSPIEDRPFVSIGAVWRLPQRWMPVGFDHSYVDIGFSPTWIAGSIVNGRDLGGNIHFTTSISIGAHLDRAQTIDLALRIQHTSNGGLNSDNPGLDMLGLSLTYNPD